MTEPAVIRRSALHAAHLAAGARMSEHDGWQRPEGYAGVDDELHAVRNGVGLADVSPAAKLDVRGNDALPALARRLSLPAPAPGSVTRLSAPVPTTETDRQPDGLLCCLTPDHTRLFISADVAAGIKARWTRAHTADTRPVRARLTDVTSVHTVIQVSGPRSRELLRKLTVLDLGAGAFPDLTCAQTSVAGVHALILRTDVRGLSSLQVCYGREFGAFVWDALLDAGREFDARPFGLTALRTLEAEG